MTIEVAANAVDATPTTAAVEANATTPAMDRARIRDRIPRGVHRAALRHLPIALAGLATSMAATLGRVMVRSIVGSCRHGDLVRRPSQSGAALARPEIRDRTGRRAATGDVQARTPGRPYIERGRQS